MPARSSSSRNIPLLFASQAMNGSMVYIAVLVPFLMSKGLSLGDVFLLQTVYAAILLLGEIPTGYISDRWGRKKTLTLVSVLRIAGLLTYALGSSFWHFVAAELFLAFAMSFYSGTVDAMFYDTLLETGHTNRYRRILGKSRFWFFGAEGVSSILGGILATHTLQWTFFATLPFAVANLVLVLCLHEPKRHMLQTRAHFRTMWDVAVHSLVHARAVRYVMLLFSVLATMGMAFFWFSQPFQEMVGLPLALYGAMHACVVLCGAIVSRYGHALERWLDDRLYLALIAGIMVFGAVGLAAFPVLPALLFLPIIRIGWALVIPLTTDMLNRMTTSDIRATVLSVKAFGQRLLFACFMPIVGYLSDTYSLRTTIILTTAAAAAACALLFWRMRTVWAEIPR